MPAADALTARRMLPRPSQLMPHRAVALAVRLIAAALPKLRAP